MVCSQLLGSWFTTHYHWFVGAKFISHLHVKFCLGLSPLVLICHLCKSLLISWLWNFAKWSIGRWNSMPYRPRPCHRSLLYHIYIHIYIYLYIYICVGNLTIIGSDNGLPVPSHYLNQCRSIINWTIRNKLQWNFNRNSYIFIQEKAFENVVCQMVAILSRSQCVNICVRSGSDLVRKFYLYVHRTYCS